MSMKGSFRSTCPNCNRKRRQDMYSRAALANLLTTGADIEASCFGCAQSWTVSPQERATLGRWLEVEPYATRGSEPLTVGGKTPERSGLFPLEEPEVTQHQPQRGYTPFRERKKVTCHKCGWTGHARETKVAGTLGGGPLIEYVCPQCEGYLALAPPVMEGHTKHPI